MLARLFCSPPSPLVHSWRFLSHTPAHRAPPTPPRPPFATDVGGGRARGWVSWRAAHLASPSRHEEAAAGRKQEPRPPCTCNAIPTSRQPVPPPCAPSPHTAHGQQLALHGSHTLGWVGPAPGVKGGWTTTPTQKSWRDSLAGMTKGKKLRDAAPALLHAPPPAPAPTAARLHLVIVLDVVSRFSPYPPSPQPQPLKPRRRCLHAVPSAAWVPSWLPSARPPPWLLPSMYVSNTPRFQSASFSPALGRVCAFAIMLACPQFPHALPPPLPLHLTFIHTHPHTPLN